MINWLLKGVDWRLDFAIYQDGMRMVFFYVDAKGRWARTGMNPYIAEVLNCASQP